MAKTYPASGGIFGIFRFYYVGVTDTLHHYKRNPLVLALSADGKHFNRQYIIADELHALKTERFV